MDKIAVMTGKELLQELKTYNQYKNQTDYYIKKYIGGGKLASVDQLKQELTKLSTIKLVKQKLPKKVITNDMPELPKDVLPFMTSQVPIKEKRLINKEYYKETQKEFEDKNKDDILNFILYNHSNEEYWNDMNNKFYDLKSFNNREEFISYQEERVNQLTFDDVVFYKRLMKMMKHKQFIYVDEENYGYNKPTYFSFVREGVILHE